METNKLKKIATEVKRLVRLQQMLSKNRNAYYYAIDHDKEMSRRMYDWIDSYNEARGTPAWYAFCEQMQFSKDHDAFDNFA